MSKFHFAKKDFSFSDIEGAMSIAEGYSESPDSYIIDSSSEESILAVTQSCRLSLVSTNTYMVLRSTPVAPAVPTPVAPAAPAPIMARAVVTTPNTSPIPAPFESDALAKARAVVAELEAAEAKAAEEAMSGTAKFNIDSTTETEYDLDSVEGGCFSVSVVNGISNTIADIEKHDCVKAAFVESGSLSVLTEEIICEEVNIGRILISISSGGVTFENLSKTITIDGEIVAHPHVRDGSACWGNVETTINELISESMYVEIVHVIIGFLSCANKDDSWGCSIGAFELCQ